MVADGDAWGAADVLTYDLGLLLADGEAKLCAGGCKAVDESLQRCLSVGGKASIISKK